jgi:hypothetical protein
MFTVLAAYLTAFYFVNIAMFDVSLKRALKHPGRLKPFDCVTCLSVWLAVIFYFLPIEYSYFFSTCFGAGWLGAKIAK